MMFTGLPKNKYVISVLLGLLAFGFVLIIGGVFRPYFLEWEEKSLDYRFRLRTPIPIAPNITTIGIGDVSLSELGGWPWKRSLHARMLRLLHRLGVNVVSMDLTFASRSTPDEDRQLIAAVRETRNVILSAGFELIDHPCFTPDEYARFSVRFPDNADQLRQFIQHHGGNLCIDVDSLPEAQVNALQEEAFWELVRRDDFVFADDNEQARAETLFEAFPYNFDLQSEEGFRYANRVVAPLQDLSRAASGFGHISATPDSDGVFRRIPLVIRARDQLFPSLALASVLHYLHVPPEHVLIVPGRHIVLKQATFPDTKAVRDLKIPVDSQLRVRINFPQSWTHLRPQSFVDILRAEEDPEWAEVLKNRLAHHICTIGFFSTSTGDIGPNPLETNFYLALLHPAVMNMILTENFLYETGWGVNLGLTLACVLVIALIAPRLSPLHFTGAVFCLMIGYIAVTIIAFAWYGIILNLIYPVLLVQLVAYTFITAYWYANEERERKHLRSAFKTYVSKQMLTKILENPQSLALQGQRKDVSILFSDIRAFSTLSDQIEPEVIHRLLNLYFSRMTEIIFRYDGFVDKFIGDGLLCFFGDPIAHPDHALRAVRSAIDMQQEVRALGPVITAQLGLDPIVIRIGINTGTVIVGNMGSTERMEYTVLGSDVNLAQRLEASATPGQIMISQATYEAVKAHIETRELGNIHVKGFEHAVQVYEVQLPFQ